MKLKKRILTIAYITVFSLVLPACGSDKKEAITNQEESIKTEQNAVADNKKNTAEKQTAAVTESNDANPTLPSSGKNLEAFIPNSWKLKEFVEGDLNNDSLPDKAAVIEREDNENNAMIRILFIIIQNNDKSYKLFIQSNKALLKSNEGGVWGDPYAPLKIDRGSVLISFYGGSNWRWSKAFRFRYQKDGWYLIGATIESSNTGSGEGTYEDYNLLTGDMIKTVTDSKGKKDTQNIKRGKKALVNLKNFDASKDEIGF